MEFTYDEIYGISLDEYCKLLDTSIEQLIAKNEKEIKILKDALHEITWQKEFPFADQKTAALVTARVNLIKKKEKHLERLKKWKLRRKE